MALFGRSKPANVVAQQDAATAQAAPQPSVADIVGAVMREIMPMIQQNGKTLADIPPDIPEDDDLTPEENQRIERVARRVTNEQTAIYADTWNTAMPPIVRESVVAKLTPGQRMIYEKYIKEVDAGVDRACQLNPALRAVPAIHQNAINLVLGGHSDEIEELAFTHATPEELHRYQPTVFPAPQTTSSNSGNGAAGEIAVPTNEEKDWVAFNGPRSRNDWTVEDMRYYKSIPSGTMAEMVAHHKAAQQAKQQQNGGSA